MFVRFRKSFFWRALLIVLCFSLIEAALAEESSEAIERRFGPDAVVTFDASGEPLLVNGFPFRPAAVTYHDKGQRRDYQFSVDFMDYPF